MELIQGKHMKASKFEPEDFISNMPDNVVTNIMDRLPLQDAVRTSILSRNWRFKWTMLSQLVFDQDFFKCLLDAKRETDSGRIISRLLLNTGGVITKFVLSIDKAYYSVIAEDISHWISFLSIKGIKDLTLEKRNGESLKLPARLFSCLELKRLKLVRCCFDPPASFHGFPNLSSLELHHVLFESEKFVKFFTQSPILENLNMSYCYGLLLISLNYNPGSSSILGLVGFLSKLQKLHLNFMCCKFTEGVVEERFPTTFPCLKTLQLSEIDLSNGIQLSYALRLISSSPNLHTLEIKSKLCVPSLTPGPEVDYNTMGLLQLRSVVLTYLSCSGNELCLIKYLLACSPSLEKIVIRHSPGLKSDEMLMFAWKLLKLHRASPVVDISRY